MDNQTALVWNGTLMSELTHAVTGAAGFIGSHLVDRLLQRGESVLGIDNMVLGRRENLAAALRSKNFILHEVDINDYTTFVHCLRVASNPIHTIWHLAANSDIPAGVNNPEIDLTRTFMTTVNVLKAMDELKIPRLCFASTSAIYGDQDKILTEDTGPLFPISNYGAMKLGSEAIISAALERFLDHAWIFRFPNVVGGRATHGAIFDFIRKLRKNPSELEVLGDGSQEKPYLHVNELVDAMLFLFDRVKDKLNYFNIAPDGSATTVRQIAETVVKVVSPGAKIRYTGGSKGWVGDVPRFRYSIEKVKAAGWRPRMTSEQAVELAVKDNADARGL
jgi:UDP-glucose 4-epimerase